MSRRLQAEIDSLASSTSRRPQEPLALQMVPQRRAASKAISYRDESSSEERIPPRRVTSSTASAPRGASAKGRARGKGAKRRDPDYEADASSDDDVELDDDESDDALPRGPARTHASRRTNPAPTKARIAWSDEEDEEDDVIYADDSEEDNEEGEDEEKPPTRTQGTRPTLPEAHVHVDDAPAPHSAERGDDSASDSDSELGATQSRRVLDADFSASLDEPRTIDMLLAHRRRADAGADDEGEVLVKFMSRPYVECAWLRVAEARMLSDKKTDNFLRRWHSVAHEDDAAPYNADYDEPERIVQRRVLDEHGAYVLRPIVDEEEDANPDRDVQYLVKWTAQSYAACTWMRVAWVRATCQPLLLAYADRQRARPPVSPEQLRARTVRVRQAQEAIELPMLPPPLALRSYQEEGVRWLIYSWQQERSTILADEMGLGKTVQAGAMLQWLYSRGGVRGPSLVVVPLSTIEQWRRELELWTTLRVLVYHGNAHAIKVIERHEMWALHDLNVAAGASWPSASAVESGVAVPRFDVLITTFERLMKDADHLSTLFWHYVIVDEAHRVKSAKSVLYGLLARVYSRDTLLLLTGTPLQNSLDELYNMLHLLQPDQWPSFDDFAHRFGAAFAPDSPPAKAQRAREALQLALRPFILRRLKEQVAKDLPRKEETLLFVTPTPLQAQLMLAVSTRDRDRLAELQRKAARGTANKATLLSLQNIVMQQRKVCQHPYLLEGVREAQPLLPPPAAAEHFVRVSAKLTLLDRLLARLRREGHKVLIFSQMTRMLDLLQELLELRGYPVERLDGGSERARRQEAVDRFNTSATAFCFLLSTRAGGLGLNLTAADRVIIYDSDWNPQNDLQAMARAHRIGQTKHVEVYRLVMRDSVEEHMLATAARKLGLSRTLLQEQEQTEQPRGDWQPSAAETMRALQLSTLAAQRQQQQQPAQGEADTDPDAALERILASAQRVSFDGAPTAMQGASGLDLSRAVFVEPDAQTRALLDDEAFWEHILPASKTPEQLHARLRSTEAPLDTPEARAEYLADVHEVVETALARADEGERFMQVVGKLARVRNLVTDTLTALAGALTTEQRQQLQQDLARLDPARGERRIKLQAQKSLQRRDQDYNASKDEYAWAYKSQRRAERDRARLKARAEAEAAWNTLVPAQYSRKALESARAVLMRWPWGSWARASAEQGEPARGKGLVSLRDADALQALCEALVSRHCRVQYTPDDGDDDRDPHDDELRTPLPAVLRHAHDEVRRALLSRMPSSSEDTASAPQSVAVPQGCALEFCVATHDYAADALPPCTRVPVRITLPPHATSEGSFVLLLDYCGRDGADKERGAHTWVRLVSLDTLAAPLRVWLTLPGFEGAYVLALYYLSHAGALAQAAPELRLRVAVPTMLLEEALAGTRASRHELRDRVRWLRVLGDLRARYGALLEGCPVPAVRGAVPVWWWEPRDDRALLCAVCEHGYHKGLTDALRRDERFGFTGEEFKVRQDATRATLQATKTQPRARTSKDKDGAASDAAAADTGDAYAADEWPEGKLILARVRALVAALEHKHEKHKRRRDETRTDTKRRKGEDDDEEDSEARRKAREEKEKRRREKRAERERERRRERNKRKREEETRASSEQRAPGAPDAAPQEEDVHSDEPPPKRPRSNDVNKEGNVRARAAAVSEAESDAMVVVSHEPELEVDVLHQEKNSQEREEEIDFD